jgi:hypothetical protein
LSRSIVTDRLKRASPRVVVRFVNGYSSHEDEEHFDVG